MYLKFLNFLMSFVAANNCAQSMVSPTFIGGTDGSVGINCVCRLSNDDYLLGGYSQSREVTKSMTNSQAAIAVRISGSSLEVENLNRLNGVSLQMDEFLSCSSGSSSVYAALVAGPENVVQRVSTSNSFSDTYAIVDNSSGTPAYPSSLRIVYTVSRLHFLVVFGTRKFIGSLDPSDTDWTEKFLYEISDTATATLDSNASLFIKSRTEENLVFLAQNMFFESAHQTVILAFDFNSVMQATQKGSGRHYQASKIYRNNQNQNSGEYVYQWGCESEANFVCFCFTGYPEITNQGIGMARFTDEKISDLKRKSLTASHSQFICQGIDQFQLQGQDRSIVGAFQNRNTEDVLLLVQREATFATCHELTVSIQISGEIGSGNMLVGIAEYGSNLIFAGSTAKFQGKTFSHQVGYIRSSDPDQACLPLPTQVQKQDEPANCDWNNEMSTSQDMIQHAYFVSADRLVDDASGEAINFNDALSYTNDSHDSDFQQDEHVTCQMKVVNVAAVPDVQVDRTEDDIQVDISPYFWLCCGFEAQDMVWKLKDENNNYLSSQNWIFIEEGILHIDGTSHDAEEASYTIYVDYPQGASGEQGQTEISTIFENSSNQKCTFNSIPTNQVLTVGQSETYTMPIATDPDGEALTFSVSPVAQGTGVADFISLNANNEVLVSPSSNNDHYDIYDVYFRATDPGGSFCEVQFILEVKWKNQIPVFNTDFQDFYQEDSQTVFTIDVSVDDLDDSSGTLIIKLDEKTYCPFEPKCTYSQVDNTFSWDPIGVSSQHKVELFYLDNKADNRALQQRAVIDSFILVMGARVNQAPSWEDDSESLRAVEGIEKTFPLAGCTDPDLLDSLTYSLTVDGANVPAAQLRSGPVLVVGTAMPAGSYALVLTCTDNNAYGFDGGPLSDQLSLPLTVSHTAAVNEPPACTDHTQDYYVHSTPLQIDLVAENLVQDPDDSQFTYSISPTSTFYKMNGNLFTAYTANNILGSSTGKSYPITITVTDNNHEQTGSGQRTCSLVFTLKVYQQNSAPYFDPKPEPSYIFPADGQTHDINFYLQDHDTKDSLTFHLQQLTGATGIQGFLSERTVGRIGTLTIDTSLPSSTIIGSYDFQVKVSDISFYNLQNQESQESFSIAIVAMNSPVSFLTFQSSFSIFVGESYQVPAPPFQDADQQDLFTFEILGDLKNFMSTNGDKSMIYLDPTENNQAGDYQLGFRITDSNSGQSTEGSTSDETYFTFTIKKIEEIIEEDEEEKEEIEISEELEEIIIATSVEEVIGKEPVPTKKKAPISKINSINNKGLVEIVFDQSMFQLANAKMMINPQVLQIRLIPSYEGTYEPEEMLLSWEVVSMTPKRLTIQLHLADPIKVSGYQSMDYLEVKYLVPFYFFSTESQKTLEEGTRLKRQIPPQAASSSFFEGMAAASSTASSSSKAFLAVNFSVNMLLSASLNMIWSLMNTMQIMVHLPLLNLSYPPNAQTTSQLFLSLANFDVVPHEHINEFVFDFDKHMKMKAARFDQMGYGETNFILNSGTSFWLLILWVFLVIFTIILTFVNIESPKFENFREKMNKIVFFQLIIRIYLECYLELLVCSLINIKNMHWNLGGERLSSLLSCLSVIILTLSPYMIHYLLSVFQRLVIHSQSLRERYGDIYEGLKQNNKQALQYPFYFLLRRQILAYTLVFLENFLLLQLTSTMVCSCALISYLMNCQPYLDSFMNRIEIMNELTILSLIYLAWCFSDLTDDVILKWNLGFLYSFIIFSSLLANISALTFKVLQNPLQKRCQKKHQKQLNLSKNKKELKSTLQNQNLTQNQFLQNSTTKQDNLKSEKLYIISQQKLSPPLRIRKLKAWPKSNSILSLKEKPLFQKKKKLAKKSFKSTINTDNQLQKNSHDDSLTLKRREEFDRKFNINQQEEQFQDSSINFNALKL